MGRGEKRLFHAIKQAIDSYSPAAVFVYNTCVPALIGDDVDAVCKAAAQRWGVPVVPVDCAGFYGTKNLGNRIAGEAMFKYVIGTREPDPVPRRRAAPRHHGARRQPDRRVQHRRRVLACAPLFDELGLRILCTLSGDARFREVQTMHRAEVNMVVCSKAMLNVARKLEDDYGMPFFEGSFYGVTDTSPGLARFRPPARRPRSRRAHRGADRPRGGAQSTRALEPWRAAPARQARAALHRRRQVLVDRLGLQDLGMNVVATGTKKSTEEDKARIRELMGEKTKMITDGSPQGADRHRQGIPGRHPDRRRPQHVHGAEGAHPLPRHQPGTRIRLRRLHRHARTGAPAGADDREPGVGRRCASPAPWAAHDCGAGHRCWPRCRSVSGHGRDPQTQQGAGGQSAEGQPAHRRLARLPRPAAAPSR